MQLWQLLFIGVAGWMNRKQAQLIEYILEENRVLRELMGRKRLRFSEAQKRRLAAKARGISLGRLKEIARVVSPQTLIKWYRDLIAGKYNGTRNRGPGRPLTGPDLTELVIRLAKENRGWGYTRIQGTMAHLGHEMGRSTIRAILLGAGVGRRSAFLRWQALVLLAASIGKVFLVDVSELSQGYRIVSFLGLGALLLTVSFVYQRDWLNLRSHEERQSDEAQERES